MLHCGYSSIFKKTENVKKINYRRNVLYTKHTIGFGIVVVSDWYCRTPPPPKKSPKTESQKKEIEGMT